MTEIEELRAEIERLKDKCDKQAMMLRRLFPERNADTYFISGQHGNVDSNGMPDAVLICPAYGCDFSYEYRKTGQGIHPEW